MSIGKFKKDELRSTAEKLKLVVPDYAKVLDLREFFFLIQESEIYKNDKKINQAIVDCVLEEINDRRNENENSLEIEKIKLSQLEHENENRQEIEKIKLSQLEKNALFSSPSDNKNEFLTTKQQIVFDVGACERRVLKEEMGSEKSEEDMELPQAIEKVLPLESGRARMLSVGPDAVAQPVTVPEEKDLPGVLLISADEMCEEKEETSVDVIKETAKGDINPVILSKEPGNLNDDEIEEIKQKVWFISRI
ncbi:uncharacterized protein TNCV_65491 [Trichonephila clavipes]|nr:uncharacterized protein TNCV_65491 [Trichonephila clavipes]